MTELLAPAGDLEKLQYACAYGADAVYFGLLNFSLRSYAGNFSLEDTDKGVRFLHKKGKKAYVTLNIYPYSNEYDELIRTAKTLEDINVDALIVSDLGVINELKKANIKTPIHVSTQANTMSWQTIMAYKELGAKRVNLARELSLEQIKGIQDNLNGKNIETEVFIHGAVCFSYSGRCAISDYMTGRKANRGECTHPCRWKYSVVEETRPGQYYPVVEDDRGLYLFNSKDLALFPYVERLKDLGVNSFKIEGRMKTIHYISSVVSLYRRIMNGEKLSQTECFDLLSRVGNRGYSEGFIKGNITPDDYSQEKNEQRFNSIFVANYISSTDNGTVLRVRNKIVAGQELELLSPDGKISKLQMPSPLIKKDGSTCDVVQNEDEIMLKVKLPEYCILRKINE